MLCFLFSLYFSLTQSISSTKWSVSIPSYWHLELCKEFLLSPASPELWGRYNHFNEKTGAAGEKAEAWGDAVNKLWRQNLHFYKNFSKTFIDFREGNDWLSPKPTLTRDWTHNLGMCPDLELNPQPFGVPDNASTHTSQGPSTNL